LEHEALAPSRPDFPQLASPGHTRLACVQLRQRKRQAPRFIREHGRQPSAWSGRRALPPQRAINASLFLGPGRPFVLQVVPAHDALPPIHLHLLS